MRQIQIMASDYDMPGGVVAVEDGQVVWAGRIEDLAEAGSFDTLFCHDDDERRLASLVRSCVAFSPEKPGDAGVRSMK